MIHFLIRGSLALIVLLSAVFLGTSLTERFNRALMDVPVIAVADAEPFIPPTTRQAAQAQASMCFDALAPLPRRIMTPEMKARAIEHCERLAGTIARFWPTDARADMLNAMVAAVEIRPEDTLDHLSRATARAPHQGWMAETRLIELLSMPVAAFSAAQRTHWQALVSDNAAVVLRTDIGANLIATWYLRRPDLREPLRQAIDASPPEHMGRVLTRIRMQGQI